MSQCIVYTGPHSSTQFAAVSHHRCCACCVSGLCYGWPLAAGRHPQSDRAHTLAPPAFIHFPLTERANHHGCPGSNCGFQQIAFLSLCGQTWHEHCRLMTEGEDKKTWPYMGERCYSEETDGFPCSAFAWLNSFPRKVVILSNWGCFFFKTLFSACWQYSNPTLSKWNCGFHPHSQMRIWTKLHLAYLSKACYLLQYV